MQRRVSGLPTLISLMVAFVASSMILGLLAAGIAAPFVGASGNVAKGAIGSFDALPSELTMPVLAQQSQILASDGTPIATLFSEYRTVVPLKSISPVMQKAQIAVEDDRFYEHGGIDARGMVRAFVSTMRGSTQGASTITQQYVRQSLISNALRNNDKELADKLQEQHGIPGVVRKLQEAKYAMELEKKLSKDQILEGYFNLVYYGGKAYGVEAAANRYFGVNASKLTLPQAAMIAGIPQQPTAYNPIDFPKAALVRRNEVLDRMLATGAATAAEVKAAKAAPLGLNPQPIKASCDASADKYTCAYLRQWLLLQPALGKTPKEREELLLRGGLTIKSSIDLNVVRKIFDNLVKIVKPSEAHSRGTAAAVVEPGTGRVIGFAQSATPDDVQVIWSVDKEYGGSNGFHIGSTAKMYSVVTAFETGRYNANSVLNAPKNKTPYSYASLGTHDCGMDDGTYAPSNAPGEPTGPMSITKATVWSVNTFFVELAAKVGVCNIKATMKDMGLTNSITGGDYGQGPALILGGDEASPLTLAASYATLAAGGKYCPPVPVDSITTYEGKKIDLKQPGCRETKVSPRVAYNVTQVLKQVGPGSGLGSLDGGRPYASKSGTSDENRHLWYVGYTTQLSTAVWVGRPEEQTPMWGYGATYAGPSFMRIMNDASEYYNLPIQDFSVTYRRSDGKLIIPDLTGESEWNARQALRDMGLTVSGDSTYEPLEGASWGTVIRTEPAAGTEVQPGATVKMTLASGWWPGQSRPTASGTANSGTASTPPAAPTATRPGRGPTTRAGG